MSYYATQRIKAVLDQIQVLHAEARQLSLDHGIPFSLELERASGYSDDHYFNPSDAQSSWDSSSC